MDKFGGVGVGGANTRNRLLCPRTPVGGFFMVIYCLLRIGLWVKYGSSEVGRRGAIYSVSKPVIVV